MAMSNNLFQKQFVLIFSLLAFCGLKVTASNIQGTAPDDAGKTIYLAQKPFLLSDHLDIINNYPINERGEFLINFQPEKTNRYYLIIRNRIAEIIIEPETNYKLKFPGFSENQAQRLKLNQVQLEFSDLDEYDPNFVLAQLDAIYDQFYAEVSYDLVIKTTASGGYRNSRAAWLNETDLTAKRNKRQQEELQTTTKLDSLFEVFERDVDELRLLGLNVYAEKYIEYVFGQVAFDMAIINTEELRGFIEIDVLESAHPEAINLLNLAYAPLLEKSFFGDGYDDFRTAINADADWEKMMKALIDSGQVQDDENADVIALVLMKMALHHPDFKPLMVLKTINDLVGSKHPLSKDAERIIEDELAGRRGMKMPDFTLLNERDEVKTASDFQEQWTYFIFFNSKSTASLQELMLLEKLVQKYGRQISFVAICLDDDPKALNNFLARYPNYRWDFLYGGSAPLLLQDFLVDAVPTAMLFNPNAQLHATYTKKPSEGVEALFQNLLKAKQRDLRIKVWDD